jgi:hypothetical protein
MGLPARSLRPAWIAAVVLALGAPWARADHDGNEGNQGNNGNHGLGVGHDGDDGNEGNHGNRGKHRGRPLHGASALLPPDGAADADALGRVKVKFFPAVGHRIERSWIRICAVRLDASTEYSLWGDDPADGVADLVQFATATTDADGRLRWRVDTKHEGTLPFGATLDALGGTALEVRSADGTTTVLAGTFPDITP